MTGLRVLVIPGVRPGRWVDTWRSRYDDELIVLQHAHRGAAEALLSGYADVGFIRTPVPDVLHHIPLWREKSLVALPLDHALAGEEHLTLAQLAGETVLVPHDDVLALGDSMPVPDAYAPDGPPPPSSRAAIELVALEAGIVLAPMSLIDDPRHAERGVVTIEVIDAPVSDVGLSWPKDAPTPALVDEFIGVVRGRTERSSRGRSTAAEHESASAAAGRTDRSAPSSAKTGRGGAATSATGARSASGSGKGSRSRRAHERPRRTKRRGRS